MNDTKTISTRIHELSRMTKAELVDVERQAMTAKGQQRIYGGPGTKDELIWSILELEGLQ